MMKKYLYMAVAAIATLSSCNSDNDIIENSNSFNNKGEANVFTATIEGNATTRTTIVNGSEDDKMTVNWSNGDQISINGSLFSTTSTTNTADFTLVDGQTAAVADAQGKYKAVYPASMYSNGTITLPASYTYASGKFNMPMYAESENTTLAFKNLCGVLAIKVPSSEISKVSTITVSSDKQMNGAFTATADGVLTFADKTLTDADKMVTLKSSTSSGTTISKSRTFYLPVPAGTYGHLRITISGTNDRKVMTTKAKSITIERNTIYELTFADNRNLTNTPYLFQRWFSVSPIKEVQFTKDNLYYDTKWHFHDYPYSFTTTWNTECINHFYWTKSESDSRTENYGEESITVSDVPFFAESKGGLTVGAEGLYALSKDEWDYLLNNRKQTNRFAKAMVSDVKGLLIFPDNYDGTTSGTGIATVNTQKEKFPTTSIPEETWNEMNGVVFLPVTGYRNGTSISNTNNGYYWSSTPYVDKAYILFFNDLSVTIRNFDRKYGCAIRLVK